MFTRSVVRRDLSSGQNGSATVDLRRHRRYPIALEVQYKSSYSRVEHMGSGTTVNISSGGVLFRSAQLLPARSSIEIALAWPFSLTDCALKLVMRGRVVRSDHQATAVQIQQYEFRTAGPRRADFI